MTMKSMLTWFALIWAIALLSGAQSASAEAVDGTTVRDYKSHGYGLAKRQYIKWTDIEIGANDTVDRIIAHTNKITQTDGKRFEELNIKLVPRVYLDWNGSSGKQGEHHHPAPTAAQPRLLTEAFQKAFKNKPVLVRHNDPEFMHTGFGKDAATLRFRLQRDANGAFDIADTRLKLIP